jgi:hypothetical protein
VDVVATPTTSTMGGIIAVSSDGSFVYTPPAGYAGSDSFDYTLVIGGLCFCKRNTLEENNNANRQVGPPPVTGTVTLSVSSLSGVVNE